MSVMYISDNHINLVLSYVEKSKNPYFNRYTQKELRLIGERIREINNESISNRYPGDKSEDKPFIYKSKDISQITNEIYFIKLLQFIRYQLDEANETTRKKDLFNTLDTFECCAILNNQGYQDAPWGID
jgi:hypothetical protein